MSFFRQYESYIQIFYWTVTILHEAHTNAKGWIYSVLFFISFITGENAYMSILL